MLLLKELLVSREGRSSGNDILDGGDLRGERNLHDRALRFAERVARRDCNSSIWFST